MKKNLISKVVMCQLKETDVSCLIRSGLLLLINRASKIFLLHLLRLYPELRIAKSSRITRALFKFTEC